MKRDSLNVHVSYGCQLDNPEKNTSARNMGAPLTSQVIPYRGQKVQISSARHPSFDTNMNWLNWLKLNQDNKL